MSVQRSCPETIQSAFFYAFQAKLNLRCVARHRRTVCVCAPLWVCMCVCVFVINCVCPKPFDLLTRLVQMPHMMSFLSWDLMRVLFFVSLLRISFGIRFLASGTSCSQWWYVIKKQFPDQSTCVCVWECVCVCSTQFAGKFALRNKSANVSPRSDWEGSPQWAYRFP